MNIYKIVKYIPAKNLKQVLKKEKTEPVEEVIIVGTEEDEKEKAPGYNR